MDRGAPVYRMTVDLNVLDHLAEGLYSSVAAVLTEAVANAWDADASIVRIRMNIADDEIWIVDDGIGMDVQAINDRYLRVGYRRREEGETTPGGRTVMGRKGIGKLSLLSIADVIEVRSKANGMPPVGLRISVSGLRSAMEQKLPEYHPEPLAVDDEECQHGQGTKILLTKLKSQRLRDVASASLRRRLARRFSIVGSQGFRVYVNESEVTAADREDLKFVEYLWVLGDTDPDTAACAHLKQTGQLPDRLDGWPDQWRVRGWIGTVDKPRRLTTPEGNLNSIVVLARGRLVHEDILPRVASAEVYTKYVTGQVEADFLDDTGAADIVTSNRQSVVEDDPRVLELEKLLRSAMKDIGEQWNSLRVRGKTDDLRAKYPRVGAWLDGLDKGWKDKAEKLLERIATMEVGKDEQEEEESRKTLLRHSILGFERLRLCGEAEELEKALGEGVDALLRLLADRDDLEAALYRDIVRNRLDVIEELSQLVDEEQKEKVLQKYLFDHLWLLDPAWERATGSEEMEERLRLKAPFKDDDSTKEKYGRLDIRYRTVAGKHVIVELKRASVNTGIYELAEQGAKYVDALKEVLPPEEKDHAQIEVVFVVGRPPDEPSDRIEQAMNSVAPGSQVTTYDRLIIGARQAYSAYLDASRSVDRIEEMFAGES